ncbi:hypothetical protein BHE97_14890 [Aeromicrobium sp. PE09-221]|nr:hypothetical protein BHE97_14890 [Aeromicrobium sp. PE09-221]
MSSVIRTCIGCRERADKSTLVRVVAQPGASDGSFAVVPDTDGTLPGRGAHLHPSSECLELAVRRRAFGRALRREGRPQTDALRSLIVDPGDRST